MEECKMDFPSLTITVNRRRSGRGKGKVSVESSLAPFSMGIALNMNARKMMDEFFANSMQVNVCCIIWRCICMIEYLIQVFMLQNTHTINEVAHRLANNRIA